MTQEEKIYMSSDTYKFYEAQIAELEKSYSEVKGNDDADEHYLDGARTYLKNILASAIILPVEKNWKGPSYAFSYPNGVIIQPKQ